MSSKRSQPEKNVLMVAGVFPPHGMVGVLRTVKFTKYLPEFGWRSTILSFRVLEGFDCVDRTLLDDVPDSLRDIRTFSVNLPYIRARLSGLLYGNTGNDSAPEPAGPPGNDAEKHRLIRRLWYTLVNTPEDRAGWWPFAVWSGLIPAAECDCIYTTGPPHTCHVVGLTLHLLTGKPLVVDYRDPWGFNPWLACPTPWHRPMHRIAERRVLQHASRVIASTDEIRHGILDLYPHVDPKKVLTITNGFDAEDLQAAFASAHPANVGASSPFVLRYFGNLYQSRDPGALFEAVRRLANTGLISPENFRLELVGTAGPYAARLIRKYDVESLVSEHDRVPYQQALRMMRESTALVIIGSADTDRFCVATKTYEYLGTRRPILALVPTGPIQRLIEENGLGQAAPPLDADRITERLESMVRKHKTNGTPDHKAANLRRYHRRELTGQLAETLYQACESAGDSQAVTP